MRILEAPWRYPLKAQAPKIDSLTAQPQSLSKSGQNRRQGMPQRAKPRRNEFCDVGGEGEGRTGLDTSISLASATL